MPDQPEKSLNERIDQVERSLRSTGKIGKTSNYCYPFGDFRQRKQIRNLQFSSKNTQFSIEMRILPYLVLK